MSKVTSIDFDTEVEVHRLEENLFDIRNFKCSNPIYEDYVKKEACDDQRNMIAQTWVFVYKNVNAIGYVSIAMGDLNKTQHEKLRGFPHTNVPGLLLGRLATHKDFECLGVGKKMVDWVFSEAIRYAQDIGCRVLYLNPETGVEGWYANMGFAHIKKKSSDDVMFFDLDIYKKNSGGADQD